VCCRGISPVSGAREREVGFAIEDTLLEVEKKEKQRTAPSGAIPPSPTPQGALPW